MIKLTKLNGTEFYINYMLIEKIETVPNTIITMNSQVQYIVIESVEEINRLVNESRNNIMVFGQE